MKYGPRKFELLVNAKCMMWKDSFKVFRVFVYGGGGVSACLKTKAMKVLLFVGISYFG
jgi:hypothetical protein